MHDKDEGKASSVRLFGFHCSFKFKRLPVLGSFVNGLFLAALLMSAAIEGIQTCFHVSHLQDSSDEKSILFQHPLTYPAILVGFALVGVIMQWCSGKAHQICQEELDEFYEIREKARENNQQVNELDVNSLPPLKSKGKRSRETLPGGDSSSKSDSQISLKSLKISSALESNRFISISSNAVAIQVDNENRAEQTKSVRFDIWPLIRFSASPLALITCALVIYLINHEFVTEITDAGLAITVVILMFGSSYPPMKRAGKVLLQTAPVDVDPEALRAEIEALSGSILAVEEFHVWYLSLNEKFSNTNASNRIGSCKLILNSREVKNQRQVVDLMEQVKVKFLSRQIGCSTVQPIFKDPMAEQVK